MKRLLLLLLVMCAVPAFSATVFVAQTAGTFSGGSACNGQTAESVATFNSGTETAGNIYYLCGVITTSPSLNGSGTSGNVITMRWDTGARISQPVATGININGSASFWLFDGLVPCGPGTACASTEESSLTGYGSWQGGIIEATANGSALANQSTPSTGFTGCNGCHDIEIRNLIVRNLYVHSSLTDGTNNADAQVFTWTCLGGSACAAGIISIHDSNIHDNGNAINIDVTSGTTVNIFNDDFYRNNWAIGNSGNGTRTVNIHDNAGHDVNNWDTTADTFHHNFLHNFTNVSSDSLALNLYNNFTYGNFGCCTTAQLAFTEVVNPANFFVYNNVTLEDCSNAEPIPGYEDALTSGPAQTIVNNTFIGCITTPSNDWAIELSGTGGVFENNVIQGYGQYVVVESGYTFTALDFNTYGPQGITGVNAWQFGSTGANSFSAWKTACACDSHGQQNANLNVNSNGVQQTGSVIIGSGTNLTTLGISTLDSATTAGNTIAAVARPSTGAWDAGAYEFGSSSGPSAVTGLKAIGVIIQ